MRQRVAVAVVAGVLLACTAPQAPVAIASAGPPDPVPVALAACTGFAGEGTIGYQAARESVPDRYRLELTDDANAVVAVRVTHCEDVTLDGVAIGEGSVAQVGITLAGGELVNTGPTYYTLSYDTDSEELAAAFQAAGAGVRHATDIRYAIGADGSVAIDVPAPSAAGFRVRGVLPVDSFPIGEVATWYDDSGEAEVALRTVIPEALSGSSAGTAFGPDRGSPLRRLVGDIFTFDQLDSYTRYDTAAFTLEIRG